MSWDFGDLSSRVNTSGSSVANTTHKYGLPGRYLVTLMGWAGNSKVSAAEGGFQRGCFELMPVMCVFD